MCIVLGIVTREWLLVMGNAKRFWAHPTKVILSQLLASCDSQINSNGSRTYEITLVRCAPQPKCPNILKMNKADRTHEVEQFSSQAQ